MTNGTTDDTGGQIHIPCPLHIAIAQLPSRIAFRRFWKNKVDHHGLVVSLPLPGVSLPKGLRTISCRQEMIVETTGN